MPDITQEIDDVNRAYNSQSIRAAIVAALRKLNGGALPQPMEGDEGKILVVDGNGEWTIGEAGGGGGGDYEDLIEITSAAAPWKTTYTDQLRTYASATKGIRLVSTVNIADDAFKNFYLRWADLPNVQSIGARAFYNCQRLKELNAPLVATLGEQAFLASGLEAVSLPLVTELPRQTFFNCGSLKSAYLPSVVTVGEKALATGLDSIDLPAAESLGYFAFGGCGIRSVSLPKLKTAGQRAFGECYRLETVELPLAEVISEDCFMRCTALRSVTLPSAKSIGSYAFTGCRQLESLTIGSASVCTLTDNNRMVFNGTPSSLKIYVPANLVNTYKADSVWSAYASQIEAIPQ